jgi:hypothetical protein
LWDCVEADFQREYQIDLCANDFSWRRFLVLLGSLTRESMFYTILRYNREQKAKTIEGANNIAHDIAMSISRKRKKG